MVTNANPSSFAAQQLREGRKVRGVTLKQLSDATAISVSTLSKIERSKTKLTVETALRIAGALQLPAASFLAPTSVTPNDALGLVPAGTGAIHETPGLVFEVLSRDLLQSSSIFWRVVIQARTLENCGGYRSHGGEEFLHVLSGRMALMFERGDEHVLAVGDSVTFDASNPHAYVTRSSETAILFMSNTVVFVADRNSDTRTPA